MILFFLALISLVVGSFASCISYRIANSQQFIFVRSKCINCEKPLSFFNLIPVFSYIFQRGKCQNCQQKISARYIIIEILFLLGFVSIFFVNGAKIDSNFIFFCCFFLILSLMSIIDFEHYFIPNSLQILLFLLSLFFIIFNFGYKDILDNFFAAFLYLSFGLSLFLLFYFSANVSAIGVDDIKLLFITGFLIGTENFLLFIFLTGILGILFGLIWTKIKKDETFPFAPALCFSMMICLIYGDKIDLIKTISKFIF